jgi:Lar family restriction alleviation protein
MIGLKHCPFCGGKKVKIQKADMHLGTFNVYCCKCFAFGPIKTTKNKAALAWHSRVDSQKRIVTPTLELGAVERANLEGQIKALKATIKIMVKK